jgi:hypothetical protein
MIWTLTLHRRAPFLLVFSLETTVPTLKAGEVALEMRQIVPVTPKLLDLCW